MLDMGEVLKKAQKKELKVVHLGRQREWGKSMVVKRWQGYQMKEEERRF